MKVKIATTIKFELKLNIETKPNGYFCSGRAGPEFKYFEFDLKFDEDIFTEVDLKDIGGMTKAKSLKGGNEIHVNLYQDNVLIVKKCMKIDPKEPNKMIYTCEDVKTGAILVQVLNKVQ